MNYLSNRLLYSLFCLERIIYKSIHYFLKKPMLIFCKLFFRWDPFNHLHNGYESEEDFFKKTYRMLDTFANDIDWGDHITDAIAVHGAGISIYIVLLLIYIKHLALGEGHYLVDHNMDLNIIFLISAIVGLLIAHITTTRKDKYKEYFERFEADEREQRRNKMWLCIAALYYMGIFAAILLSVVYSF